MELATNEASLFSSSISRLARGSGGGMNVVNVNGFGFGSWDAVNGDSVSTPRPASKIPSHLQQPQFQQQQQEPFLAVSDTPRWNPKKNPTIVDIKTSTLIASPALLDLHYNFHWLLVATVSSFKYSTPSIAECSRRCPKFQMICLPNEL
jgi:hypothetical protein